MKPTVAPTPHLRRAGLVITIASLIAIGFATLMPELQAATESHFCLVCGPLGGVSAILNVFLFVPLGIGLYLAGFPVKHALLGMLVLSVLIEAAQLLVIPGRNATIGDVITNTIGGALGFAVGRYAFTLLRPSPRGGLALTLGWSAVWLLTQTLSAFGFSPAIPTSEYYGEIAPTLGHHEPFRGQVVRASIGDVVVPDTRFPDSRSVRELLLGGAIVTTTFVPAGPTGGIAPIVRLADDSRREILLLAQNGSDLVFGVRTGAAVLRLRPPVFAAPDFVPALLRPENGSTAEEITVGARYAARGVSISANGRTGHDLRIPITASLGWTMLLPFQWFIEGTRFELVATWVWIACLLFPIGYWGGGVVRLPRVHNPARIWVAGAAGAIVLLSLGLIVLPEAFAMTAAPVSDWLAALTGMLVGIALAPRAIVAA
jgi:hypothetical protein